MENRTLSAPGSVDSIPGKGNAEDHVSNSTWCARKAMNVVENTRAVISGEILIACQALSSVADISTDYPVADSTQNILNTIRKSIPYRDQGDVWYAIDMENAEQLLMQGAYLNAVAASGITIE